MIQSVESQTFLLFDKNGDIWEWAFTVQEAKVNTQWYLVKQAK